MRGRWSVMGSAAAGQHRGSPPHKQQLQAEKGEFGAEGGPETWTLWDVGSDRYIETETFPVSRTSVLVAASVPSGCSDPHPETDHGAGWNSGVVFLARGCGSGWGTVSSLCLWFPQCVATGCKMHTAFACLFPAQRLWTALHCLQD